MSLEPWLYALLQKGFYLKSSLKEKPIGFNSLPTPLHYHHQPELLT